MEKQITDSVVMGLAVVTVVMKMAVMAEVGDGNGEVMVVVMGTKMVTLNLLRHPRKINLRSVCFLCILLCPGSLKICNVFRITCTFENPVRSIGPRPRKMHTTFCSDFGAWCPCPLRDPQ